MIRAGAPRRAWLVVPVIFGLAVAAAQAGDPAAAERQYRIARRLAAEGAPGAADALRLVVELDPSGPLAADAAMDEVRLHPVARWPEETGRLRDDETATLLERLDRILASEAGSNRAVEATYFRAMVELEPSSAYDRAAARTDLIAVTAFDEDEWTWPARYALAWLDEQHGDSTRAAAGYGRIVVDAVEGDAAARARAGLGRLELRGGRYGRAAAWFDHAAGTPPGLAAADLKELAVRALLRETGSVSTSPAAPAVRATLPEVRSIAGTAAGPGGTAVVADRKTASVLLVGDDGTIGLAWKFGTVDAVAVDPWGRFHAAADGSVFRLDAEAMPVRVASVGEFGPVLALAVDGGGRIWVLDRRGERLGRIDPGQRTPTTVWEGAGTRLESAVWDGRRVVGLDRKGKRLIAIEPEGSETVSDLSALQKPIALAADHAGRTAVLDGKDGAVWTFAADGAEEDRIETGAAGIAKPAGLCFGFDGVPHVFDETDGRWMALR